MRTKINDQLAAIAELDSEMARLRNRMVEEKFRLADTIARYPKALVDWLYAHPQKAKEIGQWLITLKD